MNIKGDYLIEKRNVLNEIRANNMTFQELRFFSIYLSMINARDVNTRLVQFTIADFTKIMEFKGHNNLINIKRVVDGLLCKLVYIPDDNGGVIGFQLFKECRISKDEKGKLYITIDAHDRALPLMFEFKEKYFTYQLWNALNLRSSNQLRMYEVLKQYEYKNERVISVKELRDLLGIGSDEYAKFSDFRNRVLDACQKALEEHTDIKYTYEPYGKRGPSGKILNIKFTITKNENYVDKLSLNDFIDMQDVSGIIDVDCDEIYDENDEESAMEDEATNSFRETILFLSEACNNEFDLFEMRIFYDLAIKIVPFKTGQSRQDRELEIYDYLNRKYNELEYRASRRPIKKRFNYLKKIITVDLKETE